MPAEESIVRLSGDNIIELIKERRNDMITQLLYDEELDNYLNEVCNISGLSGMKREFIKRALKELSNSPLDLSHYSQVILAMRKTGGLVVSTKNEAHFQQDIRRSIKSYLL